MKKLLSIIAILSLSCFLSCGGKEEKKEEKESMKIGTQKTEKVADANSVNVALTGNDMMQYDKNEIIMNHSLSHIYFMIMSKVTLSALVNFLKIR